MIIAEGHGARRADVAVISPKDYLVRRWYDSYYYSGESYSFTSIGHIFAATQNGCRDALLRVCAESMMKLLMKTAEELP